MAESVNTDYWAGTASYAANTTSRRWMLNGKFSRILTFRTVPVLHMNYLNGNYAN